MPKLNEVAQKKKKIIVHILLNHVDRRLDNGDKEKITA